MSSGKLVCMVLILDCVFSAIPIFFKLFHEAFDNKYSFLICNFFLKINMI